MAILAVLASGVEAYAASVSGTNSVAVKIPDDGGFVASTITISGAPEGAVVKGVDVSFKAVHSSCDNLNIDLNADAKSELGNYSLWDLDGGSADNPSKSVEGVEVFDGLPVNRTWFLYARDEVPGDEGFLDEWSITVHFDTNTGPPSIDSVSPDPVPGADRPQAFTINGNNFACPPNVTLHDLARDFTFPNRSVSACSSTSLTINPNFKTGAATWTVEVKNPDGKSSGKHSFKVVAPSKK